MEFIRYLDDFVILLERENDLKRLQEVLPKRLAKFSLTTNESKSQVLKFGKSMAQQHDVLHYLGFTLYRTKNRVLRLLLLYVSFETRLYAHGLKDFSNRHPIVVRSLEVSCIIWEHVHIFAFHCSFNLNQFLGKSRSL